MAPWVRALAMKARNLNSNPQHPGKSSTWPELGVREMQIPGTQGLINFAKMASFRFTEKLSKTKVQSDRRILPTSSSSLYLHVPQAPYIHTQTLNTRAHIIQIHIPNTTVK